MAAASAVVAADYAAVTEAVFADDVVVIVVNADAATVDAANARAYAELASVTACKAEANVAAAITDAALV